jgi:hypothetical protein
MGLFLSTTGIDVEIEELGYTITDPTTDYEISAQFTSDEIADALTLTAAIQAGTLIWRKTAGGVVETASEYDPDYLEVEELSEGSGDESSQVVKRQGYRTSMEIIDIPTTEPYVYSLTKKEHHIHRLTGGKATYTTLPHVQMPDATTLEVGHQYMVFNESLGPIEVDDFGDNALIEITITKRVLLFLADNSTPEGVWDIIAVGKSSLQGTAPVLAYYGGNANNGRYLEIFPGDGSDVAPFVVPANAIVVAVVNATNNNTNGSIEIVETPVVGVPSVIYTLPMGGTNEQIALGLAIPVGAGSKLSFRVAGGSMQRPRLSVYLSGA